MGHKMGMLMHSPAVNYPKKNVLSALTQISNHIMQQQLLQQQKSVPVVKEIFQALSRSSKKPSG
ncbi:MAG: hypothetical protein MJE68_25865, partial [Proteobacteria bacterium]|nr:hypothetical protein [Pseudomonadota bacterium]